MGDCARVERLDSSTGCSEVELTEAEDHLQTAEQSQLRNLRPFFGSIHCNSAVMKWMLSAHEGHVTLRKLPICNRNL